MAHTVAQCLLNAQNAVPRTAKATTAPIMLARMPMSRDEYERLRPRGRYTLLVQKVLNMLARITLHRGLRIWLYRQMGVNIGKDCVEIAAKRGLGRRVVEGHKAPERLIYCPRTDELKVLNLSKDDIMIKFEKDGGVKQVQTEESRPALSPVLAKKLAKIGLEPIT